MKTNRFKMAMAAIVVMFAGTVLTSRLAEAATRFSIGIGVGPSYGYYAPPPVVYRPMVPGPGYFWTQGFYSPYGEWVPGYWARRPYYVAPYYAPSYRGFRRDYDRDDRRWRDRDVYRGWRR